MAFLATAPACRAQKRLVPSSLAHFDNAGILSGIRLKAHL